MTVDRDNAARLGLTSAEIDNILYDAFGQRQVSTIYKALNQYHVVMEAARRLRPGPDRADQHLSLAPQTPARVGDRRPAAAAPAAAATDAPRAGQHAWRLGLDRRRRPPARRGAAPVSAPRPGRPRRPAATRLDRRRPSAATAETDRAAVGLRHLGQTLGADLGQPPGRPAGDHHLVQPAARQIAQRRHRRDRPGRRRRSACRPTVHGSFQGTAKVVPAVAGQRADADPGRAARRLHRAGHALRELHPPADGALDPALGRRRRGDRADPVQDRVQHHRPDRRHPADRHREEERHPDDRLRAGGRARRRACRTPRRHPPGGADCASGRS